MFQNKTQRQNISTRTALNSSQLIDRSITNGAKLISLPPESPLFGRSDKLVRDLFETKESVYKLDYIDKKYSMRKTFMCGAMKSVSLLFDQPT